MPTITINADGSLSNGDVTVSRDGSVTWQLSSAATQSATVNPPNIFTKNAPFTLDPGGSQSRDVTDHATKKVYNYDVDMSQTSFKKDGPLETMSGTITVTSKGQDDE